MQIETIRKAFEAFECKIELLERDSKRSNANLNHSKGIRSIRMLIWTIRKVFEAFESRFDPFERIRSIRVQIKTIRKGFEAFKCKF